MIGTGTAWRIGMTAILVVSAPVACRKPGDARKSDLEEAGYQLTQADWFRAARGNDVSALRKFVAAGFSVETPDPQGDSALHAAAAAGAEAAADFLLDRGLAVDRKGSSGRTPLMAAVMGDQTPMVRWLVRQGADPRAKDQDGFIPLMLAVKDGRAGAVSELAALHDGNLDSAILLAALSGQTEVIDTLTNYGASVYARMEDGRTPLMIAAENGHAESVKLLLDIGASRFSTDNEGRSAADLAIAEGHPEIAELILREPKAEELALESPQQVAEAMEAFVEAAKPEQTPPPEPANAAAQITAGAAAQEAAQGTVQASERRPTLPQPIDGAVLSEARESGPAENPVPGHPERSSGTSSGAGSATAGSPTPGAATAGSAEPFRMPPLVMRHYRQREMPIRVRTVEGESATLEILGSRPRDVRVKPGETIPSTGLVVIRVQRRMEDSKLNLGRPMEVSVVEVRDPRTGTTREWISGVPSGAHDPVALVEDAATGKHYLASPGRRFKSADGGEFIVTDVRPSQIVIEDAATGAVRTLPLRGPRG